MLFIKQFPKICGTTYDTHAELNFEELIIIEESYHKAVPNIHH